MIAPCHLRSRRERDPVQQPRIALCLSRRRAWGNSRSRSKANLSRISHPRSTRATTTARPKVRSVLLLPFLIHPRLAGR